MPGYQGQLACLRFWQLQQGCLLKGQPHIRPYRFLLSVRTDTCLHVWLGSPNVDSCVMVCCSEGASYTSECQLVAFWQLSNLNQ